VATQSKNNNLIIILTFEAEIGMDETRYVDNESTVSDKKK
jgi:hypothetical protein